MNRTKNFIHNTMANALLQAANMLAGFVLPRIMLGFYGSEINGLVTSLTQFIVCFNLVEAGISAAATYSLYDPLARRDIRAINAIIVAARNFYNKTGFIFVSLTLGLAALYPFCIQSESLSAMEIALLVLVLGVSGALEFFTLAKYRCLLTADQRTWVISLASLVAILLNVALTAGAAYAGASVVLAKGIALGSVFLRTGMLYLYCHRHYSYMDFSEAPNNAALSRRYDALYLQILGVIHASAPVLLATMLTDLKTVSVFAVYSLVATGLQSLLGIFTGGLAASFGDVIARGEQKILQEAVTEFELAYNMLIAAVYAIAAVLITPFVLLYTAGIEDVSYNMPVLGVLLMLNGWLYNLKTPQGMLVIAAGLYRETRWQTTVQGLIEIFVSGILGLYFGLYGILIGMIASNVYRDIDLPFFISRKLTRLPAIETFRRELYGVVIGLGTILPCMVTGKIHIESMIDWLFILCLLMIYTATIVCIIGVLLEKALCKKILSRFKPIK